MAKERVEERIEEEQVMFKFPILEIGEQVRTKNINPHGLPHFHGMAIEDPKQIIFKFDVICRTYDYKNDAQKLRLFTSTLKEPSLRWSMDLDGHSVQTWEQMKDLFTNKYQEYCK